MVVDACFIASQIDVWTQAYNGPTSRRKYVLNLLNVLHKNVTEEYKTDQFLHVIYWFLIYKSNLGHFFRNEGIFPPILPLLFFHQLLHAQTSPAGQVPAGTATSGICVGARACAPAWGARSCLSAWVCTRMRVRNLQTSGGRERVVSLHLCHLPHLRLKIWGEGLMKEPHGGVGIFQMCSFWAPA